MRRSCGVLLPISALPSPYGIGTLGKAAYDFVDFLTEAGQSWWQLLPVGPTSYGDSPYQSFSTYAGNPYFVDLDLLVRDGLLKKEEIEARDWGRDPSRVDYAAIYRSRFQLLQIAADRGWERDADKVKAFSEKNAGWLPDYALFMALKFAHHGKAWTEWEPELAMRNAESLQKARSKYIEDVQFFQVIQYWFYSQWDKLKTYCNENGISLIGDMPIYVSYDSVEVWSQPELFELDEQHRPIAVAGCPPDVFSPTGQLWGNPLYDWPRHKAEDFAWWKRRMQHATSIYDVVRIDHFRGFESYYAIPAGNKTAAGGHWEKGPDRAFINAIHETLGQGGIIAEDLGYLTPEVKTMLAASGYPGMKIMQFAFDSREPGNYLPYTYPHNSVVYTGTHDNVTTEGWRQSASPEDVHYACRYLRCLPEDLTEAMICACLASVSDMAIIPMADWLHLGAEARINTPSTQGANWQWRLDTPLTSLLAEHIPDLTALYDRAPAAADR